MSSEREYVCDDCGHSGYGRPGTDGLMRCYECRSTACIEREDIVDTIPDGYWLDDGAGILHKHKERDQENGGEGKKT